MRRWTAGILALLVCGAVLAIARPAVPERLAPQAYRLLVRGLELTARLAASPTLAAEELRDWKPVAPESAAQYEGGSRTRRATAAATRSAIRGAIRGTTRATISSVAPAVVPTDSLVPIEPPDSPSTPSRPGRSGEMMRIGSDIHVDADQTVVGDVVAISGDVTVDGHVKGDVMAMKGDVYLSPTARVDGDVVCLGGELHEETGAYVGGQRVTALGGRKVRLPRHEGDEPTLRHWNRFGRTLVWLLVDLGLLWLILRIAPGRSGQALERLRGETAASLGIGLLTWVLLVPSLIALCLVVVLLVITIIGIPVALAALFGYFVLIPVIVFWGAVIGSAWLGEQVAGRGGARLSLMRAAATGTILLVGSRAAGHLIGLIPWFGVLGGFLVAMSWIVTGVIATLGTGALVRSEFKSGTVGNWWRGVRKPRGETLAPAPATGVAQPAPFTPPPPPPAAAPPANPYTPPSEGG